MIFSMDKLLIFTATYNEVGNIEDWYSRVRSAAPNSIILIVDDNSTDGTSEIIRNLMMRDSNLNAITRPFKLGVGSAHQLAFSYAYENGFEFLITLDADLSHQPEEIRSFLDVANTYDFIIGTRRNGGSSEYSGYRLWVSVLGNVVAQILLPTGLTEYTTSFRFFNRSALTILSKSTSSSNGYAFFMEVIEVLNSAGLRLGEIPINFKTRFAGESKIPANQIWLSALALIKLVINRMKKNRVQ